MLDWTTSFLSDALIIKPEIAICQTLSQAIQDMVRGVMVDHNWLRKNQWTFCGGPYGIQEGGGTIATDVERRSVAA
jgi:hypothetical protein